MAKNITRRERSTIQFPYNDLDEVVELAKAMFQHGGGRGSLDQIAAWTKHDTSDSGTFRLKMSAARMFGLIEGSGEVISLAPIGLEIVDPREERSARAQAFLQVPLYRAVYERFKGQRLPGDPGLGAELRRLGVAPKLTDRARRTLQRSARQGGFLAHGDDRLEMPSGVSDDPTASGRQVDQQRSEAEQEAVRIGRDGSNRTLLTGPGALHPFVRGLLDALPPPNSAWSLDERKKWLETADRIFSLMYKES